MGKYNGIIAHMKAKTRKVLVLIYAFNESGREILYGVDRFARTHCNWRLRVVNFNVNDAVDDIRRAEVYGIDGIIACGLEHQNVADYLRKSKVPLVCICCMPKMISPRRDAVALVNIDDVGIGRHGAEYLYNLGRFRSYGFVSKNDAEANYTYTCREKGFLSFLKEKSGDAHVYRTAEGVDLGSLADIAMLAEWLKSLPKPAAVMAAHDVPATHVVEAAELAGIRIPEDLAIIGVDNDKVYCETSIPTLTSIMPNHIHVGELAAKALKKLMQSPAKATSLVQITSPSNYKVIERQSTKPISPVAQLVNRAESFIRQNATKGMSAADVAADLGVSRRLADLRFRQATGKSILEAILERRFDEMKRLLRFTDIPVGKIIASCGFNTASNAKSLFKKRVGMSMREFRARS